MDTIAPLFLTIVMVLGPLLFGLRFLTEEPTKEIAKPFSIINIDGERFNSERSETNLISEQIVKSNASTDEDSEGIPAWTSQLNHNNKPLSSINEKYKTKIKLLYENLQNQ